MKRGVLALACLAFVILGPACNEENGGGNGGGDDMSGVLITGSNAAELAGLAATAIDLFPGLTDVLTLLVDRVPTAPLPGRSPAGVIDLGDLGICSSGEAIGTWNDADGDGRLSVGDRVDLEIVECDGEVDGTLSATFLEVGGDAGTADLALDLTIRDSETGSTRLTGRFRVEVESSGGNIAFRYLVPQNTSAAWSLQVAHDGVLAGEMGCFNFYFLIDPEGGGYSLHEPVAVFRLPGRGILSLVAWGLSPLLFPSEDVPESGQLAFWAEADVLPCAALDVPSGGVDANDSHFTLTAGPGGALSLDGETAEGEPFHVEANWDEIR